MQLAVTIRERGAVPRRLRKAHNAASKDAWVSAGTMWHTTYRDQRFKPAHARKAGYAPRQGEKPGISQKEFWNSYTGQKIKRMHHRNPLQWSGEVRDKVKYANISSTATKYMDATSWTSIDTKGGGCKVAYPGASKLNFRRWPTSPRMADEFRKITDDEKQPIASKYDAALDAALRADQTQIVTKVA
jgi:hypothetical protein